MVIALNNAGTIELAAVNISGGFILDESTLISTTAEGGLGAADSATVIYSTTARTSVAYRVIGYIDSTQATAGNWATAPSTIQGNGGQASVSLAMNASGLASMFACRAWVSFDGTKDTTGAVSTSNTNRLIRGSGNVTSVLRNAAGDYTITFTTAMTDANYCAIGTTGPKGNNSESVSVFAYTSSSAVRVQSHSGGAVLADAANLNWSIFR